jgi:hypothetical protein
MSQTIANSRNKFIAFLVIFVGMVLFQLTELRYIWGITDISRFYNVFFLLILSIYIALNIYTKKLSKNIWFYYILPGLLVFIGYFVNITINMIRDQSLSIHYGSLIPWIVYLAVPFLLKDNILNAKSLLRYYYFSTLLITTLGLFDYFLYFNGFINLQVLNHPNGIFLSGWFSILHMLEDGSGNFRFYASMGEPGNLGMILIPSIIYSILYKRYIGAPTLILGLYLTNSLGAFIGVGIVITLLPILLYRKYKYSIFIPMFSSILILSTVAINWDKIYGSYEEKENSRIVREENIVSSIKNFKSIIVNHPLGINYSTNYSENTDENYYGSNFMILNAFYKGGVLALIAYITIISVFFLTAMGYFFRKKISREDIVYSLSIIAIIPFIFQRMALLETSILVLVITPFVIKSLSFYSKKYKSIGL